MNLYRSKKITLYSTLAFGLLTISGGIASATINDSFNATSVKADSSIGSTNSGIHLASDSILQDTTNFPNIADVNNNNPLGIASLFSIFSKNTSLSADTNGNIATKSLSANNIDFGTRSNNLNNSKVDLSYIQNISDNTTLNAQAFRAINSVAIFGNTIPISIQNNQVKINSSRVNTLNSNNTYQDQKDKQYIDFNKEFSELSSKSEQYMGSNQSEHVTFNFSDQNQQSIDISKADQHNNIVYVDIDYSVISRPQPITIKGLSSQINGANVIVNVKNVPSNATTSAQINYEYDNGKQISGNSENHFLPNHVLWNFGTTVKNIDVTSGRLLGSILAPNATVNVGVNIDGNIVASNVNVQSGETHRWDISTPTNNSSNNTPANNSGNNTPTNNSGNNTPANNSGNNTPSTNMTTSSTPDSNSTHKVIAGNINVIDTPLPSQKHSESRVSKYNNNLPDTAKKEQHSSIMSLIGLTAALGFLGMKNYLHKKE